MRPSLSSKILLLALLNVSLLAIGLLIFARIEFRFDLSSFLLAPARDRIVSVSSQLALQLLDTDSSSWNSLLKQYHAKYPADFYLFDYRGIELAGEPVILPKRSCRNFATIPLRTRMARQSRSHTGMNRVPQLCRLPVGEASLLGMGRLTIIEVNPRRLAILHSL